MISKNVQVTEEQWKDFRLACVEAGVKLREGLALALGEWIEKQIGGEDEEDGS